MIDKRVASAAQALEGCCDGAVVLVGGFGNVGHPFALIDGLIEQGAKDLTIVCNNAGTGTIGLPRLLGLGRVRKVVCSFPRSGRVFTELHASGKIELEIVPQGTLVERIRAGGAGIGGFYTRTAVGTVLEKGKEHKEINGQTYILENPIRGDFALVEAWEADRWGNLTYRGSGRNFNPVMATAADISIAQVQRVLAVGAIDPNEVETPSLFIKRLVEVPYTPPYPGTQ